VTDTREPGNNSAAFSGILTSCRKFRTSSETD
jgi:hypothetical protein